MRLAFIVATALLILPVPATAATPLAPGSGSSFTTTDTVTFEAQSAPEEADYTFVFADTEARYDSQQVFALGRDGHELGLDLGWLAMKFDHIGTYWWGVCPVTGPDLELVAEGCSPPFTFSLRFRLANLTGSQSRSDTRWVMAHQLRSYWRGFSGRKLSCMRVSRTRRRCRVSGFAGDTVLDGRVTIYLKRERSWSASYFRARLRLVNEYCHLVNKRPLLECQRTRRRSGPVYA